MPFQHGTKICSDPEFLDVVVIEIVDDELNNQERKSPTLPTLSNCWTVAQSLYTPRIRGRGGSLLREGVVSNDHASLARECKLTSVSTNNKMR